MNGWTLPTYVTTCDHPGALPWYIRTPRVGSSDSPPAQQTACARVCHLSVPGRVRCPRSSLSTCRATATRAVPPANPARRCCCLLLQTPVASETALELLWGACKRPPQGRLSFRLCISPRSTHPTNPRRAARIDYACSLTDSLAARGARTRLDVRLLLRPRRSEPCESLPGRPGA